MKFPNAAKGVSKIFTAEILGLIALILTGIGTVGMATGLVGSEKKVMSDAAAAGTAVGGGIFFTIGAIVLLVGAVINIVGLVQAGKDEKFFKYALYAMIIFFVFSLIVNIALSASGFKGYATSGGTLITLIVNILVIQGIINLANAKQDARVASKGLLVFKLIIAVTILEIIVSIIVVATQNKVAATIAIVLSIAAIILGIVRYIIYLSMLSNAKKMLAEDVDAA